MIHDELIEPLLLALVNGVNEAGIITACQTSRPELQVQDIKETIKVARTKLTRAAEYNRDEEFAMVKRRYEELYIEAKQEGRTREAIAIQKELSKLMDLHRRPSDANYVKGESEEIKQIREHLEPLEWGALPIVELVRLAVLKIIQLQAQVAILEKKLNNGR